MVGAGVDFQIMGFNSPEELFKIFILTISLKHAFLSYLSLQYVVPDQIL